MSPALTTERGHSTQTKPRGLAALVPSRLASRCLLPGALLAAASSCAPCALNSLQRSSAPITCLPLRLVGPEPDGVGGDGVLCGLSHRAPRGLIWHVQAPRSHHRLHEVVSVHAQEADLHADPNLR